MAELTQTIAEVAALLGTTKSVVIHGSDGLDEITMSGPTQAYDVENGQVQPFTIFLLRTMTFLSQIRPPYEAEPWKIIWVSRGLSLGVSVVHRVTWCCSTLARVRTWRELQAR